MHIVYLIYQKFRTTYIDLSSQMSSFSCKVEDEILVTTCSTGYQNLLKYSFYSIHWCISSHFELPMVPICHLHAQQGEIASHHESTCRAACMSCTLAARRYFQYLEIDPSLTTCDFGLKTQSQLVCMLSKSLLSERNQLIIVATIFAVFPLIYKILSQSYEFHNSEVVYYANIF